MTVFFEIKARFDEYANLQIARLMSKAGNLVFYS